MSGQRSAGYAPEQEVRFAVVLYGGVSLAIYINGVAQELLRMVRATADLPPTETLSGSELVYRELGQILSVSGSTALQSGTVPTVDVTDLAAFPIRTRFVVDIVSGSSAGGINGIALAKALALRIPTLDRLRDVWLNQADLDSLLNDEKSEPRKYPPHPEDRTVSLINSERMYGLVLKTLTEMNEDAPKADGCTPFADNIDLFVTATDLAGLWVPMQLAGHSVDERLHKNVFHFEYEAPPQGIADARAANDFVDLFDPMLAFAARCTSSFPVAFEPMSLDRIKGQLKRMRPDLDFGKLVGRYRKFFRPYIANGTAFENRLFADGGYLDNRPFSYATDIIQFRSSTRPVERNLLFVDPFPEPSALERESEQEISFIENAMLAAMKLPRYEVIRGDIQAVNELNRQLNRLDALRERIQKDGDKLGRVALPESPRDFAALDLRAMVEKYGYGDKYPPYHHLRVYDVSDTIARILCRAAGFAVESDHFYFIRMLVRSWREANFETYSGDATEGAASRAKQTENAFLYHYDFDYRARRLNHLRVEIDKRLKAAAEDGLLRDDLQQLREVVELQLHRLRRAVRDLEGDSENPAFPDALLAELKTELRLRYDVVMNAVKRRDRYDASDKVYSVLRDKLDKVMEVLKARLAREFDQNRTELASALAGGSAARADIKTAYDCFHWHDSLTLPFLQGTRAREYSDISVFRVSPADGGLFIGDPDRKEDKLAGTRAAAFGGFMDRAWRDNDMMWGRLDGAERIITALLPGEADKSLRDHYVRRVQDAILAEEFSTGGRSAQDRIYRCLAYALRKDGASGASVDDLIRRGDDLLKRMPSLAEIVNKNDFRTFLKTWYSVPSAPANEHVVDWSARALRIFSRMIDDLPRGGEGPAAKRVSRTMHTLGVLLTGLLRLILPRSLWRDITIHALRLIAVAGLLIAAIGFFVEQDGVGYAGVAVLAIALVAWLLLYVGLRLITGRLTWLQVALTLVVVVVLPLAVFGGVKAWELALGLLSGG